MLLKNGHSPNEINGTRYLHPLEAATIKKNMAILEALLKYGADPFQLRRQLHSECQDSPFFEAIKSYVFDGNETAKEAIDLYIKYHGSRFENPVCTWRTIKFNPIQVCLDLDSWAYRWVSAPVQEIRKQRAEELLAMFIEHGVYQGEPIKK